MNTFSFKKIEYIALVAILLCGFLSITYADICDGNCQEAPSWDTLGYYQISYVLNPDPPCLLTVNYKARYNPCTGKCEVKIETVAISPAGCSNMTPKQLIDSAGIVIFEAWPPDSLLNNGPQNYDPNLINCVMPQNENTAEYLLYFAQCVRWADSTVLWNSGPELPPNAAYLIPCGDTVGCCQELFFIYNDYGNLIATPQFPSPLGSGISCETQYQPCFYICTEP